EVLEPGVGLLDQEQLMGFALFGHQTTSVVMARSVGPPSDSKGARKGPKTVAGTLSPRCTALTTTCRARCAPPSSRTLQQRARTKEIFFALVSHSPEVRGAGAFPGCRSATRGH